MLQHLFITRSLHTQLSRRTRPQRTRPQIITPKLQSEWFLTIRLFSFIYVWIIFHRQVLRRTELHNKVVQLRHRGTKVSSFHFIYLFTVSKSSLIFFRYYVEASYYQQTEAPAVYYSYTTTAVPSYYVAPISYSTAAPSYNYAETYTPAAPMYYSEAKWVDILFT